MQETWNAVDGYIEAQLVDQDDALRAAAGGIGVSPALGKLLHLLTLSVGASRVLELGTLHGYSTIWMARALPAGGQVVSLELDPDNAETARGHCAAAGVTDRVDVRVGRALDLLPEVRGPFDLVFIDANKDAMAEYFAAVVPLTRPGGLIVGDNTVRGGRVADSSSDDPMVVGVRRFCEAVGADPRVDATGLQTVGVKGYDGFVLARVR